MQQVKKTDEFSKLGSDVLRTQRARADINSLEQYSDNITNAHRRINQMVNTLDLMIDQVGDILEALRTGVQGGDAPDFETTQELAKDVYDFLLDLINTEDGERFLFAGSDSQIQPIEDKGLFSSFLGEFVPDENDITAPPLAASGFIGDWGNGAISTQEFISTYRNVNDTTLGYSNALSTGTTGKVSVRVDDNSDYDYTVLGNTDGIKNMVIALGVLVELPPPENAPGALNDPTVLRAADDTPPFPSAEKQDNFYTVVNDLVSLIANSMDDIEQQSYKLSLVEAQTATVQGNHEYQINTFRTIISDIEDADITEVSVQIQRLQTTLQASFSVTALTADLTLVNFLT